MTDLGIVHIVTDVIHKQMIFRREKKPLKRGTGEGKMNNYFVKFSLTGYYWRGITIVEKGFRVEAASAKEAEEKGIHRMESIIKQHPRIYKRVSFELVSCEEV